jgi:O-antigen ligase
MMAIGGIACVSTMIAERRISLIWGGGFALCFFLIIMSKGATSLISLVSAVMLAGVFMVAQRGALWKGIAIWVLVSVGALVTATVLTEKDFVLKLLGKDPTLTGRSEIWDAVFRQVEQSPLLGFGFAAFWQKDSAPAQWVRTQTGWPVPTAHNGWIDLIVQVGWIGAILFGITFAVACIGAATRFTKLKDGYLSVLILWIFTILSLSESVIMQHNSLGWALFIAALARTTGPLDNAPETWDRLDHR